MDSVARLDPSCLEVIPVSVNHSHEQNGAVFKLNSKPEVCKFSNHVSLC